MESNRCGGACRVKCMVLPDRGLTLRPLTSDDLAQVKVLCLDCFPIDYSEAWLKYVTSGKVLTSYSVAISVTWLAQLNEKVESEPNILVYRCSMFVITISAPCMCWLTVCRCWIAMARILHTACIIDATIGRSPPSLAARLERVLTTFSTSIL